jgi:hypothetical protein
MDKVIAERDTNKRVVFIGCICFAREQTERADWNGFSKKGKALFLRRNELATGIPESLCKKINLGYRDPKTIRVEDFANREDEGVLLVPKAGEMLYRLKNPPKWAAGS